MQVCRLTYISLSSLILCRVSSSITEYFSSFRFSASTSPGGALLTKFTFFSLPPALAFASLGVVFFTAEETLKPGQIIPLTPRVSLLTGRYPEAHRVRTNHNIADATYTEDIVDGLVAALDGGRDGLFVFDFEA